MSTNKRTLINFQATPEERERWRKALESQNKTATEICKAALDRFAARVERLQGANE